MKTVRFLAALAAFTVSSLAQAQGEMYRCPNNDYKNTISPKDAERLGCKKLDGAPVTVIQTTRPRALPGAAGTPVPPASGGSGARVDSATQRERDSDAKRILESELKQEEERLTGMKKDFNNGQPERLGNEQNYQKYLDRVAEMRAAIVRKEGDVSAIRRELLKVTR